MGDARPAKKVKPTEKVEKTEATNPKLKAAADAKKTRKRAADFIEEAAPAVKPVVEDSPKPKKVKISKKVEIVEPEAVPTSISKDKKSKDKKEKKSKKGEEEKALIVAEQEEEIALPVDDDEEEDVAALLAGFSSDESEGEEVVDKDALSLDQLPEPALDKKAKKALAKAQKKSMDADAPGTIYVGRIPHGFYEPQMRAYFTQFGQILNLRLSRNKKTGASKHYAFIQFASSEVADIVARTMNNYLMFGHILKVRLMPEEQIHPDMWKNANKRFKVVPRAMLERKKMEEARGREYWREKVGKEQSKREKKRKAMQEMGYEYEAPKLKTVDDVPMQDVEVEAVEGAEGVKSGEDLVKAIADPSAVVDEATADIEKVIADGKKAKKEKKEKKGQEEKVKVKASKKVKA